MSLRHTSALLAALLLGAPAALAQTAQPGAAPVPNPLQAPATPAKRSRTPAAEKPAKEPTPGQSAARERQRKCGAEWKEAKAAGKVAAGMKWPQYWSQCNTRLKQQKA
jgi:hypothetical protein